MSENNKSQPDRFRSLKIERLSTEKSDKTVKEGAWTVS